MEPGKALPTDSELSGWRARRLIAAGFAAEEAHELASKDGVDLHALLERIQHRTGWRLDA
jgi:hypothetical protein